MTTALQNWVRFLYGMQSNTIDFDDTVSVSAAKITAKYRLWFTTEAAANASKFDKFICQLLPVISVMFFVSALAQHVIHPDAENQEVYIHKVAYLIMMTTGLIVPYISLRYPAEYSKIIDFVNRKSKECLTRADRLQIRPLRNRIYLFLILLIAASIPVVFFVSYPIVTETLLRGHLYFNTILPINSASNSPLLFLEFLLHFTCIFYVYGFGTVFLVMILEPYLRLAHCYQIIAKDVRELRRHGRRSDESSEFNKLVTIMKEYEEIRSFVIRANRINASFFAVLVFASFIFAGVFLAVSFSAESFMEKFTYIAYPLHTYLVACLPCALSEYLLESGRQLELAVYECRWYDGPLRFQKLVLLFLLRCQRPVLIDAKPFYELNLFLVARITKSIYAMATVAHNFF